MLNGGAQLGIAVAAIGGLKIWMIAVKDLWAVARFKLLDSVECLHHALFCPVHSGRCLPEDFLALGVLMAYASKGPHVIEADFMFNRVGVPQDMPEKLHSLLR